MYDKIRGSVYFFDRRVPLPVLPVAQRVNYWWRHSPVLNRVRRFRDYTRGYVVSRALWSGTQTLHLGCGTERKPDAINSDIFNSLAADYILDAANLPFAPGTIERIESYHMVEHIPKSIFTDMLSEWHRVLKSGGEVVIELPDFDACIQEYLSEQDPERIETLLEFVFGGQRHKTDVHYWGWNAERLQKTLIDAGFEKVVEETPIGKQADVAPCLRLRAEKL